MKPTVGKDVTIFSKNPRYPLKDGRGRIVHIFPKHKKPNTTLIQIYYGITPSHKDWKSVNRATAKDRVVISRFPDQSKVIIPYPSGVWDYSVTEDM